MLVVEELEGDVENCAVCFAETKHWYKKKDVPVCPVCASRVFDSRVPSKKKWLEELGFKLPKNWVADVDFIKVRKRELST